MGKNANNTRRPRITRRRFLITSSALAAGSILRATGCAPWKGSLKAGAKHTAKGGDLGALDATKQGGIDLYIERKDLLVGGRPGRAITINGSIPGPIIRMREGENVLIRVHNRLAESTSIHWHGILLPFNMDGVPGISFPGIAPGKTFTYRYKLRQHGTYWYHSHSGMQEQLGHYGQLIVEPAGADPVEYDTEHSIVLSDWTFQNPGRIFRALKTMEGYYNFQRPTIANLNDQVRATEKSLGGVIWKRLRWNWMRMDPTDIADVTGVTYSFLMNGLTAEENPNFVAGPGQRVRLRITNASAMTYYDIRIPGLPMTVVQADGQNVEPVEVDELRVAVAETYDVIVRMPDDQAYTIFAETMDRSGFARGTLAPREGMSAAIPDRRQRPMLTMADMGMMMHMGSEKKKKDGAHHVKQKETSAYPAHREGDIKPIEVRRELPIQGLPKSVPHGPDEHGPASITMAKNAYRQLDDPGVGLGDDNRRVLTYGRLRALKAFEDRRPPTREINLHLTGNMHKYIWGFNGIKWSDSKMIRFKYGERLRINFLNDTMMNHPIHLHGMWMDLYGGHEYGKNPRKHTVNVQPAELLTVDINADAPGQWAFHCHLLYHMEAGMFRTVAVVRSLKGAPINATG